MPGGAFVMGTSAPPPYPGDGEGPPRLVVLSDFRLDRAEVTRASGSSTGLMPPSQVSNAQFDEFVRATRYVTESETFG